MAKQKEENTLPKTVFVYRDTYLVAAETRNELAESDVRLVGTYRLIETGELVRKPKYARKRFVG